MKNVLLFITIVLALSACKNTKQESLLMYHDGEVFGTFFSVRYESQESYHQEIQDIFRRVNQSMSTYMSDSDISKINANDSLVKADSLFIEVFNASVKVWQTTDGLFDPTVGPLVNAYGFGPLHKMDTIQPRVIDSLLQFVGLEKVSINEDGTVLKNDPRIFIDFNAIAKGYTVDLIGEMLEKKGVKNYLVEIGGEILTRGINVEKNKAWTVAIDHPLQREERTIIQTISLKDRAMATSGNYRKFYTDSITGDIYTHTINPKTGKPRKNNILSITVLANQTMYADAYATALMIMDLETSKKLAKNQNMDVYIIYFEESDKKVQEYMSDGFKKLLIE